MSADNYIRIKEYKDKPRYRISEQCASVEPDENYFAEAETIGQAVVIASEYDLENYVEYGIKINLLKE
jgi:hypothetical protein